MKRNTTFLTDDQRLQLIDLLHVEACSCVIRNGDVTRIFRERGVKDLYRLLEEEPELLDGAFVADKVVGKGAAALDRKSTRLNSSHWNKSRMPSSA